MWYVHNVQAGTRSPLCVLRIMCARVMWYVHNVQAGTRSPQCDSDSTRYTISSTVGLIASIFQQVCSILWVTCICLGTY